MPTAFPRLSKALLRRSVRLAALCTMVVGLVESATAQNLQDSIGWGLLRFNTFNTSPAKPPSHPGLDASFTEFFQVSCGAGHTIALRHDPALPDYVGYVVGWGFNEFGQSTIGLETNASGDVVPWSAMQVSAGYAHSILLRPDGSVHCWGDNRFGQCDAPPEVTAPSPSNKVVQIAAGHYFSVALMKDGTLRGWGDNRFGQLNFPRWPRWVSEDQATHDPDHPGDSSNAVFDLQPKRFFRITAGANHVVGLLADNQATGDAGGDPLQNRIATAWGDNSAGQCNLTQSSPMFRRLPQSDWPTNPTEDDKYARVSPYATQIAAGVAHTLLLVGPRNMLLDTNHLGANYRSLNIYTTATGWYRPVRDGMVFGVGSDAYGQAMVPTSRRRPKIATDPSDAAPEDPRYRFWGAEDAMRFKTIAAGGYHSMAVAYLMGEERLYCWGLGANGTGSFGDFGQVNDDPTKVAAAAGLTNVEPTYLARRASWSFQPQIGIDVAGPGAGLYAQRVAGGLYHTAAITYQWDVRGDAGDPRAESAVVVTWGRNAEAQCNVPYEPDYALSRKVFRDVAFKAKQPLPRSRMDSNIRALWAGGFMPSRDYGYFNDFVVGLDRLGFPVGWGDNSYLQREFFALWSPVVYDPTLKYVAAAPGGRFTWLLDNVSRQAHFVGDPLFCFADEFYAPFESNLAEISAGGFHSLFRTMDGRVYATGGAPYTYFDNYLGFPVSVGWGQGAWDADGIEFSDAAGSPFHEHLVPGLLASKVSAGWFHSAAVRQDGTVKCWGAGSTGGANGAVDPNQTPNFAQSVPPAGLEKCTDIAAGGFHTAALANVNPATKVGTVVTWGNNAFGQRVINGITSMVVDADTVVFRRTNGDIVARSDPVMNAQTDIESAGPGNFIAAGYGSTALIDATGVVQFFGNLSTVPMPVDPATGEAVRLRSLAIGESHVLGVRPDGSVIAWGGNNCNEYLQCWSIKDESQWSSRNTVATVAPTRRSHQVPSVSYDACVTVGGVSTCITAKSTAPADPLGLVRYSGDLVSWNGNEANENQFSCCIPTIATFTTDRLLRAVQVAAGRTHSVALRQDGNLQAWGGVTRDDDTFITSKAVLDTPTGGLGVSYIKVCAGRDHNIAMQVLGSAQVWGDNSFGQVSPSPELALEPGLLDFDVRDIAAGDRHTVILKTNGRVYAWGDETYSEVDGVIVATRDPKSPASIPADTFGVAVAAGGENTAVLRDRLDPRLIGKLASLVMPTFIDSMPQAIAVRAGGFHTVALLPTGAVQAWGAGQDGTSDDARVVGLSTFPNYGQSIPVMRGPDYSSTVKVVLPLSTSNPNPITAGALTTAVLQKRSDMTGPPFASLTGGDTAGGPDAPLPDFDGDGCVTTSDLAILLGEFGNGAWPGADLDANGEIDMGDVAVLQMQLGECQGVPLADAAVPN